MLGTWRRNRFCRFFVRTWRSRWLFFLFTFLNLIRLTWFFALSRFNSSFNFILLLGLFLLNNSRLSLLYYSSGILRFIMGHWFAFSVVWFGCCLIFFNLFNFRLNVLHKHSKLVKLSINICYLRIVIVTFRLTSIWWLNWCNFFTPSSAPSFIPSCTWSWNVTLFFAAFISIASWSFFFLLTVFLIILFSSSFWGSFFLTFWNF